VKVESWPCECGRTYRMFEGGVIGRVDDVLIIRGVNVFPSAVENIVRRFKEVDEFRVTVRTVREMDEMDIEVELADGANPALAAAVGQAIDSALSFRPNVSLVPRGTLPRFELKARRFHVQR